MMFRRCWWGRGNVVAVSTGLTDIQSLHSMVSTLRSRGKARSFGKVQLEVPPPSKDMPLLASSLPKNPLSQKHTSTFSEKRYTKGWKGRWMTSSICRGNKFHFNLDNDTK